MSHFIDSIKELAIRHSVLSAFLGGAVSVAVVFTGGIVLYTHARSQVSVAKPVVEVQITNTTKVATSSQGISVSSNTPGTVSAVNVKAGDSVVAGAVLLAFQRTDLAAQITTAKKTLADAQAKLKSLSTSASTSVAVSLNDQNALTEAQNAVRAAVRNAYISANDVINNKATQFFSNPNNVGIKLGFFIASSQTASSLASKMLNMENIFPAWQKQVLASSFNTATSTALFASQAQTNLNSITSFLSSLSAAVGNAVSLSPAEISSDKTILTEAQLTISNALAAVISAETDEQQARAAIATDTKGQQTSVKAAAALALKNQQTTVSTAQTSLNALEAQVNGVVKAPVAGTVTKVSVSAGKTVSSGQILFSIAPKK